MPVQADVLVHSAALSSPWGRWSEFHEANVAGTEAMIDLAQRSRIRRFVFVSSPSIYPRGGTGSACARRTSTPRAG